MSLLLVWSNDEVAHILSDGLSLAPDGRVVSTTRKKFFRTAAGHLIGACGFSHLRQELARRFADSLANFDDLVTAVGEFVYEANRKYTATAQSRPIGAIVCGIDGGRVRSANISAAHIEFSRPGWPAVHWCTAADESDPAMLEVARGIYAASENPHTVPQRMRAGAERLFKELPGKMGGKIFEASLFAEDVEALSSQGSVPSPGAYGNFFSYSSSDNSVTWTWSAFSIPMPNGTTISVAADSTGITFSGLSASTTYYFGAYYDLKKSAVKVILSDVSSGTGQESSQQAIQVVNGDNHIPIAINLSATTASSGGGGGSGSGGSGSTCPEVSQVVETRERGFVAAGELRVGDFVRGWLDGEWNRVEAVRIEDAEIIEVEIAGEHLRVDANHLWLGECGTWVPVTRLTLETALRGADGGVYFPIAIRKLGPGKFAKLSVERGRFRLGRAIAHNSLTYTL